MLVLAMDTSTEITSCALLEDNKILADHSLNQVRTRSESLVPMIRDMLNYLEIEISDIDLISVIKGPGSFTGLRIGVTIAKTLAQVLDKPIVGISSLEAMANGVFSPYPVCPIIDARGGRLYSGIYQRKDGRLTCLLEDDLRTIDDLILELKSYEKVVITGDCLNLYREDLTLNNVDLTPANLNMSFARSCAVLAKGVYEEDKADDLYKLSPNYLRKSQAQRDYDLRDKRASSSIRRAEENDVDQIFAISKESFKEYYSKENLKKDITNNKLASYFCMESESGNVIAYLGIWTVFDEIEIITIAVSPSHRNKGLANKLLKFLLEKARKEGIKKISLEVRKSNYTAIHLYEKIGFEYISVRKNYYQKGSEDAVVMQYKIEGEEK